MVCLFLSLSVEPKTGIEPMNLFLTKEALYQLSYLGRCWHLCLHLSPAFPVCLHCCLLSGQWESNPQRPPWKGGALAIELCPQAHLPSCASVAPIRSPLAVPEGRSLIPPRNLRLRGTPLQRTLGALRFPLPLPAAASPFQWAGVGSNHRRRKPLGLQPSPINRSGTYPKDY